MGMTRHICISEAKLATWRGFVDAKHSGAEDKLDRIASRPLTQRELGESVQC